MSLRQYATTEELQELLDRETEGEKRELPENNLLENTLKLEISGEFTATNLEVYGCPDASPQCYFFVEYSDVQCPFIIFERHISSVPGTPFQTVPFLSSTGVFYMTQTQREQLLKEKLDAPEGFTFERADADRDAETIHRLWKTALDQEVTKNRLCFLPSACARTESGELAGWAMTSRIGQVTNLYVLPEYRNRGLGKALELSVAKQFASRGMRVFKYVETTNTPVYEGSLRSPLWTLWTTEGSDEEKSPMLHSLIKFVRSG